MPQPNVLLITAAGWRDECLRWNTPRGALAPNLHALAAQAAKGLVTADPAPLAALRATLPSALHESGYHTAFIGESGAPRAAGLFDILLTAESAPELREHDDYHAWLLKEGLADRNEAWRDDFAAAPMEARQALGAVRAGLPERAHVTTWMGLNAVRVLQQALRPFFLWAHFPRPAFPFDPPSPWDELVPRAELALPQACHGLAPPAEFNGVPMTPQRLRRVWSHYLGNAALLDHQVGRLLSTLTARAITNTAVVFAAASHAHLGEDGQLSAWQSAPTAQAPLPFLAAGPARAAFAGPPIAWPEFAERLVGLTK